MRRKSANVMTGSRRSDPHERRRHRMRRGSPLLDPRNSAEDFRQNNTTIDQLVKWNFARRAPPIPRMAANRSTAPSPGAMLLAGPILRLVGAPLLAIIGWVFSALQAGLAVQTILNALRAARVLA